MSGRGAYAQRVYRGRGAYYNGRKFFRPLTNFARVVLPKGTMKTVGSLLGAPFGAAGSKIGKQIGANVARAVGFGDYHMGGKAEQIPSMHPTRAKSLVVRHCEYLGNVVTGAAGKFNNTFYDLNPGLPGTFPWLAQIATGFEEYQFNALVFEYKSTSADALNSTNTALGSVIMATEYDSSRDPFENQQQMANHEFANSGAQSQSMLHAIECKRSVTVLAGHRYIRTGAVPTGDDERFYDHGKFQIATVGQQAANVVIGELWCSYEVEFFKPQLISGLGLQLATDMYQSTGAINNTAIFGLSGTMVSGSNIGCKVGFAANGQHGLTNNNTILFPDSVSEGLYQILIGWSGTADAADAAMPTNICINGDLQGLWFNKTADEWTNAGVGQKPNIMMWQGIVKITASPCYITWADGVWNGPDGANCTVSINQWNGSLSAPPIP